MKISPKQPGQLVPSTGNPKQHDPGQVSKIADSITAFGFNVPVLVDEQNRIVAGHGRVLAAQKLGLETVPTIALEHLDEHQKKAFMLADNRLAELGGGWDEQLLKVELADLHSADFEINLTGFTEADFLEDEAEGDDLAAENQSPELATTPEPVTLRGDVWQLGEHRLFCGDATQKDEVCGYIKEERAELMFTDPPYGVNYVSTKQDSIVGDITQSVIPVSFHIAVNQVLNKNARLYLCGRCLNCPMYFSLFNLHLHKEAKLLIWVKENILMRKTNYHSQYELIFFGWKGKGGGNEFWHGGRTADNCSDVFQIHRDHSKDYVHPTQKPVELSLRCITNSSQPGDLVYDPFGGSGSTLIACEKSGRRCRMMEIDPHFCDVILQRWQQYTEQPATHADTGQTFEALTHERQKTPPH